MEPTDFAVTVVKGRRVGRREFLTAGAAGAGALLLAACGGSSTSTSTAKASSHAGLAKGGTLNLWTWPDYYAPANLKAFQAKTGTKLNIATYDSNDTAFAKLNTAGGASFDIVVPTSDFVPVMAQHGLLQKLDHSRIPLQYVDPKLLRKVFDPHNDYSIPKDYGTIGVIYNPAVVKHPIRTWQDYLDAGAQPGVSGKVELADVPDETLGIALWAEGKDWNTDNLADLRHAAEVMKAFAKHVHAFNEFDVSGVTSGAVVMAVVTQGTAREMMLQKKSLKFVIPQPQSELWVDNYCITAKAPDVNQAYSFIDYMLQPAHQLKDCAFIGYPTALPNLQSKLPASVPLRNEIFISPADFNRLVPHVIHPAIQGTVENLYSEIQAAAA
ncbi:MAG TPA: spermidine/putrescine ABC transporter substrate-binding protein [Solirubrobacteraceae bacterium]|nr:spermidine/putrescine ABC transporter substrate-binding protein [Solirubrobacteraceae bacterium]